MYQVTVVLVGDSRIPTPSVTIETEERKLARALMAVGIANPTKINVEVTRASAPKVVKFKGVGDTEKRGIALANGK